MKTKTKKWLGYIGLGVVTFATVTIVAVVAHGIGYATGEEEGWCAGAKWGAGG